jgi:hypothetical protein
MPLPGPLLEQKKKDVKMYDFKMYLEARNRLSQKAIILVRSWDLAVAVLLSVAMTSCGNLSLNVPQGSSGD